MIAVGDAREDLLVRLVQLDHPIAAVEQVGDLFIPVKPLARRARHDNAPILVGKQNLPDLFELRRVGQRTSAEFCYFHTHSEALRFSSFSFSRRMGRKISQ